MFNIKITGLNEISKKFNNLKRTAKQMDGKQLEVKVDIQDHEVFTLCFLQKYTKFTDFADYEAKTKGFDLNENSEFIQLNTQFKNFQEMTDKAIEEMPQSVMDKKIAKAQQIAAKQFENEIKRAFR